MKNKTNLDILLDPPIAGKRDEKARYIISEACKAILKDWEDIKKKADDYGRLVESSYSDRYCRYIMLHFPEGIKRGI